MTDPKLCFILGKPFVGLWKHAVMSLCIDKTCFNLEKQSVRHKFIISNTSNQTVTLNQNIVNNATIRENITYVEQKTKKIK